MTNTAADEPRATTSGLRTARILLTIVGLVTMIGCYIADWNETHIYNPTWPPHAKFHNAQTMLMGAVLGACTLFYTWRRDAARGHLGTAVVFGAIYWVTQAGSIAFPGTAFVDPEAAGTGLLLGVPAQLVIDGAMFLLLAIAAAAMRRGRR